MDEKNYKEGDHQNHCQTTWLKKVAHLEKRSEKHDSQINFQLEEKHSLERGLMVRETESVLLFL